MHGGESFADRLPAREIEFVADPFPQPFRGRGSAAVSVGSSRPVYADVVEQSVCVAAEARGLGIGKILLRTLIDSTERAGIWTIHSSLREVSALEV